VLEIRKGGGNKGNSIGVKEERERWYFNHADATSKFGQKRKREKEIGIKGGKFRDSYDFWRGLLRERNLEGEKSPGETLRYNPLPRGQLANLARGKILRDYPKERERLKKGSWGGKRWEKEKPKREGIKASPISKTTNT